MPWQRPYFPILPTAPTAPPGPDGQPKAEPETAIMPTEIEDYLFDLRGYLLVENALDQAELNALNTIVDELSPSPQQEAERAALELSLIHI